MNTVEAILSKIEEMMMKDYNNLVKQIWKASWKGKRRSGRPRKNWYQQIGEILKVRNYMGGCSKQNQEQKRHESFL